jgi:hypothetical protein
MNISTGMHATREVQDSLLSAVNEGEKKCKNFGNSALSVGQSVSFYSPISKSKLKTFEHMNAKTSLNGKSGEIMVRRSLSVNLMEFFTSYRSNTSATVCAFAKHDVNGLQ